MKFVKPEISDKFSGKIDAFHANWSKRKHFNKLSSIPRYNMKKKTHLCLNFIIQIYRKKLINQSRPYSCVHTMQKYTVLCIEMFACDRNFINISSIKEFPFNFFDYNRWITPKQTLWKNEEISIKMVGKPFVLFIHSIFIFTFYLKTLETSQRRKYRKEICNCEEISLSFHTHNVYAMWMAHYLNVKGRRFIIVCSNIFLFSFFVISELP